MMPTAAHVVHGALSWYWQVVTPAPFSSQLGHNLPVTLFMFRESWPSLDMESIIHRVSVGKHKNVPAAGLVRAAIAHGIEQQCTADRSELTINTVLLSTRCPGVSRSGVECTTPCSTTSTKRVHEEESQGDLLHGKKKKPVATATSIESLDRELIDKLVKQTLRAAEQMRDEKKAKKKKKAGMQVTNKHQGKKADGESIAPSAADTVATSISVCGCGLQSCARSAPAIEHQKALNKEKRKAMWKRKKRQCECDLVSCSLCMAVLLRKPSRKPPKKGQGKGRSRKNSSGDDDWLNGEEALSARHGGILSDSGESDCDNDSDNVPCQADLDKFYALPMSERQGTFYYTLSDKVTLANIHHVEGIAIQHFAAHYNASATSLDLLPEERDYIMRERRRFTVDADLDCSSTDPVDQSRSSAAATSSAQPHNYKPPPVPNSNRGGRAQKKSLVCAKECRTAAESSCGNIGDSPWTTYCNQHTQSSHVPEDKLTGAALLERLKGHARMYHTFIQKDAPPATSYAHVGVAPPLSGHATLTSSTNSGSVPPSSPDSPLPSSGISVAIKKSLPLPATNLYSSAKKKLDLCSKPCSSSTSLSVPHSAVAATVTHPKCKQPVSGCPQSRLLSKSSLQGVSSQPPLPNLTSTNGAVGDSSVTSSTMAAAVLPRAITDRQLPSADTSRPPCDAASSDSTTPAPPNVVTVKEKCPQHLITQFFAKTPAKKPAALKVINAFSLLLSNASTSSEDHK